VSQIKKYFSICVNTGENLAVVSEIEVSSITQDGEFFKKMWKEYDSIRGFRTRYFRQLLVKPVDVRFVKVRILLMIVPISVYANSVFQFSVEHHQRADISCDPPDFPGKREVEEGRYEYEPCPLTTRPTAGTFLHYRNCTKCSSTRKWLPRVPKKLWPAVLDVYRNAGPTDDVIGWGVHIIEGPNRKAITWLCILLLVISITVSVLYARLKGDTAAGFGVGAVVLSSGALLMPAFYFQWK
jgi:hypothetical protein